MTSDSYKDRDTDNDRDKDSYRDKDNYLSGPRWTVDRHRSRSSVPPSDRHLYHDFLDFPFFHTHRDTSTLKENYPGIWSDQIPGYNKQHNNKQHDKVKPRRGGGRRCRCYERWRVKAWGDWILSHTRLSGGSRHWLVRVEGIGEGVNDTLLSHTLENISLTDLDITFLVGLW